MASWWGRFAGPVACRPHCRRRGRLNPFKGVVMGGGEQKGEGPWQGYRFLRLEKRTNTGRGVSRASSLDLVCSPFLSFFFSLLVPLLSPLFSRLSSERSMVDGNIHRNLYGSSRITLTYAGYVYAFFSEVEWSIGRYFQRFRSLVWLIVYL